MAIYSSESESDEKGRDHDNIGHGPPSNLPHVYINNMHHQRIIFISL